MKQSSDSKAGSRWWSKFALIIAALLLMTQSVLGQNANVSFNFNNPGQYDHIYTNYFFGTNDWLTPVNAGVPNGVGNTPPLFESVEGGVGSLRGSGAIDLHTGNLDVTTVLQPITWDFSQVGTTLKATIMLKLRFGVGGTGTGGTAPTANNRATQIGFVSATNVVQPGINAVTNQAFMSVILQSTAQPAYTYQLRYQTKVAASVTATEVTPTAAEATASNLTPGNWYKLQATFVNASATTVTIAGTLTDMGADGLTPGAVVATLATSAPITLGDMASNNKVYLAIRRTDENTAIDYWDDIMVESVTGATGVLPLPATTDVPHGGVTQIFAKATGDGPFSYQWNKDGSPLAGQTNWKLVIGSAVNSDAGSYTVTVTGKDGNAVTSSATTLNVTANPLAIVGVGSVDGGNVGVMFNQNVDRTTALQSANYAINGSAPKGVTVMGRRVILVPANPLTANYTVTVQNVKDLSGTAIAAGASANGRIEGFTAMDINNAGQKGYEYSFGPGQFEVWGGGSDIWNAADQFRFLYKKRTGDFDVAMKVPYEDVNRTPFKAGFNVRDSLAGQAIEVGASINPPFPGRQFAEGAVRQSYNTAAAAWGNTTAFIPANGNIIFPNVWLRLRRTGQNFTRYTSADGVTWRADGQVNVPLMPQTVFFGIGVCSVAQGEIGRAVIENYQELVPTPGATITIQTQPPASATVSAGSTTNLTLAATWSGSLSNDLQVVWQRYSGSTWTNIPNAGAGGSFTTPALYIGDNGAQYRAILMAPGATSVTSDVTTVTVNDTAGPTATASLPASSLYTILVTFSEPVDPTTALNKANYSIVNSASTALTITDAKFATQDQRVVALTVSTPLPAGDYFVSVSGVKDLANNTMTALANAKVNQAATPPTQVVVVEMYNNVGGGNTQGDLAGAFEGSGKFQFHLPDFIFYQNVFGFNSTSAGLADTGWNNYGARVFSYFVPPTTGNYKFYLGVDDVAVLYFNPTGTDPSGALELGRSPNAFVNANYLLMTNYSTNISLTAGQKYYLEARFKEGGGGDGVRVQAVLSSNNTVPGTGDAGIPASQLAYPSDVALRTPVVSELYTGPGGAALSDLDAAAATTAFVNRTPNITTYQKDFATMRDVQNSTRDNYIGRMFSYFVPPADGLYRLWFRSDDSSRVYMNTNEVDSINPAGAKMLGGQDGWNANYISSVQNIPLKGGQKYYLEGRWKEGGGGDGMTVVFHTQDDPNTPVGGTDATAVEVQSGDNFEFPFEIFTALGPVTVGQIAPVNPTVAEGQRITFSIPTPGGAGPTTTTWYKNGQQIYFGANSFTTEPLTLADSGSVWTVVVSNPMGYQVRSTTLTVNADSTKPLLLGATGSYLDVVRLDFSEALDRASAINFANYTITPNVGIWRLSFDENNRNTVLLYVTPLTPNQVYNVSVSGVKDFAGNVINTVSKNFSGWAYGGQGLLVEYFNGAGGTAVAQNLWGDDATYKVNNPAASGYIPFFGFGTETQVINNFLGGTRNNFGVRVVGLYHPDHDGYYRFAMRGDDETRLFMNTNGPSYLGKVQVARNVGANSSTYASGTGDSQGSGATSPFYGANSYTPLLFLKANTEYYMEGYMKEGGGGDYIAVVQYEATDIANDNPRDSVNHPLGSTTAYPINDTTIMVRGANFRAPANPDLGPVTYAAQPPATLTLGENSFLNLTVNAQGVPAAWLPIVKYQWQRLNTTTSQYENIEGATGTNYSKFVTAADAGQYRVIVSIPTADRVFNTTLTVSNDTTPPTVLSATPTNRLDRIYIKFSEPVVAGTFSTSHFAVSGGVTVSAVNQIDATTAELVTSPMQEYTDYTVTISDITDLAGLNTASVQKQIKSWKVSKGFWRVEFWDNVDPAIGVNVTAFVGTAKYAGPPDSSMVVSGPFTTRTYQPNDNRAEQYGARMTALFTPPSDGDYNFFVGADDQITLQISTDDKPENLGPIIASDTSGCCQGFQEPGVPETTATPITLQGGKAYLMVVVFKEGGGGDWAQVAFRKVGDTTPAGSLQPIPAQYLSIYGDPTTQLDITLQPQSQSVLENRSVTLTMSATSPLAVGIQWQVDTGSGFTDIAGATGSSYTTPLLQLNQTGIKYRAVVTGFGNTKTTDVATITVLDDATGPALTSANTYTSPNTIWVRFNEPIATASSTLLSDDFAGADIDPTKWVTNATAFEVSQGGTSDMTVTQSGGQITMAGTATASFWGGVQLTTVNSYTASPSQLLRFSVDRVSMVGTGTAYRASIRIRDAANTNYVLFSQNVGEGGWEYNRLANLPGDNAIGNGTDIAAFDTMEDGGSHHMEILANGSTVRLYLDGIAGPEVKFPVTSGIQFEVASYVRALGDSVTTVFDNAKVERVTAQGTYTLNNGATVTSVDLSNRPDQVVLHTSALNPSTSYTLTAAGVTDLVSNTTATQNIAVNQLPAYPVDIGTSVAGYQDSFDAPSRDARWIPRGPGGDVYNQNAADEGGRGTLLVTTANGDPNHLLFEDPSYDKNNQEILARIKVVNAANGDAVRAGLAASVESTSQGFDLHFRDEGTFGRHIEFLDDNRSWGPEFEFPWVNNQYYWMRFKVAPNAAPGAPDLFGKIWKGDGTEPEPDDWQMSWDRGGRTGFAGITASSNGGLIETKLDYFALKSTGLPNVTLAFQYEGGVVPPQPAQITITKSGANITITWTNGGKLQSANALTNPGSNSGWADVPGATTGSYVTTSADAPKFFRVVNQ